MACVVTISEHGLAAKRSTKFGRCNTCGWTVKGSWEKVSTAATRHEDASAIVEIAGIPFTKSPVAAGVTLFMFDPTKGN